MTHINLTDSPLLVFRGLLAMDIWPYIDLGSILKPNSIIVILNEFTFHS